MSIASEITRIQGGKASLKSSLNAKNDAQHQITDETIDEYYLFADSIQTGSSVNIFIQDTQPSGYNGIWVADSTYENYPIVFINDITNKVASSINIVSGIRYNTLFTNDFEFYFNDVIITDSNNDKITGVNIYYGNGTQWFQLPHFIQLEYIQSNGSQYINTGISFNSKYQIKVRYKLLNTTSSSLFLFGLYYQESASLQRMCRLYYRGNSYQTFRYQYYRTLYEVPTSKLSNDNNWHDIDITRGTLTCDGEVAIDVVNYTEFTVPLNIYVFNSIVKDYNQNPTIPSQIGDIQISKFTLIDTTNNNTVMDLVPAKDNNNVVCMYDKITDTYFYNAGSGTFTAGNEV